MIHVRPPQSLHDGLRTSVGGIQQAQERFATAGAEVVRQGAIAGNELAAQARTRTSGPPSPPNPGPPGGAQPADLAQAMVDQRVAAHDFTANVETLKAFDEMLDELTRLKT